LTIAADAARISTSKQNAPRRTGMKHQKGDKIEANKMIMVITGERDDCYHGYYEYNGKAVGQCSISKELLSNPHFAQRVKKVS
jgi:hypothetical protein